MRAAADHIYLSQTGMRKPEARVFISTSRRKKVFPPPMRSFDDNADNIEGANQLGITSILVKR